MDVVLTESNNLRAAVYQEPFYFRRGTIPQPDPDDLGRKSEEEAALSKVGILGYDDETVLEGVVPHPVVCGVPQAKEPYVR